MFQSPSGESLHSDLEADISDLQIYLFQSPSGESLHSDSGAGNVLRYDAAVSIALRRVSSFRRPTVASTAKPTGMFQSPSGESLHSDFIPTTVTTRYKIARPKFQSPSGESLHSDLTGMTRAQIDKGFNRPQASLFIPTAQLELDQSIREVSIALRRVSSFRLILQNKNAGCIKVSIALRRVSSFRPIMSLYTGGSSEVSIALRRVSSFRLNFRGN